LKLNTYLNAEILKSKELAFQDPKKSFELAKEAYELSKIHCLEIEEGLSLFQMAYACRVMSKYSEGLNFAFKSLDIMKKNHHVKGIYKAMNIIGIIYFYYGAMTDALENFMSALSMIDEEDDFNLMSSLLNNIGEVYREAGAYVEASTYYHQALEICLKHNLNINASAIYLNLGEVAYQEKHYSESNDYMQKGYALLVGENRLLELGEAETKIGRALVAQGFYDQAKSTFLSALNKLNSVENKYYLVDLLIEMARLDQRINHSPMRNLNEALSLASEQGLVIKEVKIYEKISNYYESKGDFAKALAYYKRFHLKQAEVEASNLSKRLEILSVEFDYYKEKKENLKFRQMTARLEREIESYNRSLESIRSQNQELLKESLYDELTKIYNRRGLEKAYQELFENNSKLQLAVLIVDIDRFKGYNDTWGHVKGDTCLVRIAEEMSNNFKQSIIARYGGEEFLIIVQVDAFDKAYQLAEKFRENVQDLGIQASIDEDRVVTVSVGGYFGTFDKQSLLGAIEIADKELYKAKDSGRNKVRISKEIHG